MKIRILLVMMMVLIMIPVMAQPNRVRNDYLEVSARLMDSLSVVRDSFNLQEPVYYEISIKNISDLSIPYKRTKRNNDLVSVVIRPRNWASFEMGDVNPNVLDLDDKLNPGDMVVTRKPIVVSEPGTYWVVVYPAFSFEYTYWPDIGSLSRAFTVGGRRGETKE